MSSNLETVVWLFVAIFVIGVMIYIVGYFSGNTGIKSTGTYTAFTGLIILIIIFIVYSKIKNLQQEERFVDKILEY
jgi:hypothetical protein